MPTYHFVCDACGTSFEEHLPMGSAVPPCASCKSTNVRKILRAPMVHFKGSGFYKTDSSGTAKAKSKEASVETPKPAEIKSEMKPAETKPAEKKVEPKK